MKNTYLAAITLISLLAAALPATATAGPARAKATATVSARVLQPVSLAITQEREQNRLIPGIKVSSAQKLAYQLQVNSNSIHSYQHSSEQASRSMQLSMHDISANQPRTVSVTLNFN